VRAEPFRCDVLTSGLRASAAFSLMGTAHAALRPAELRSELRSGQRHTSNSRQLDSERPFPFRQSTWRRLEAGGPAEGRRGRERGGFRPEWGPSDCKGIAVRLRRGDPDTEHPMSPFPLGNKVRGRAIQGQCIPRLRRSEDRHFPFRSCPLRQRVAPDDFRVAPAGPSFADFLEAAKDEARCIADIDSREPLLAFEPDRAAEYAVLPERWAASAEHRLMVDSTRWIEAHRNLAYPWERRFDLVRWDFCGADDVDRRRVSVAGSQFDTPGDVRDGYPEPVRTLDGQLAQSLGGNSEIARLRRSDWRS
jgi:hypothetical protein